MIKSELFKITGKKKGERERRTETLTSIPESKPSLFAWSMTLWNIGR